MLSLFVQTWRTLQWGRLVGVKGLPRFVAFVLLCAFLSACHDVSSDPGTLPLSHQTRTITVGEHSWTYVNLTTGQVVGTSALDDAQADAQWQMRTDWDVAFCGDMIRTNSGTSGNGSGGLQVIDVPYEALDEAPYSGYAVDTDDNEIYK